MNGEYWADGGGAGSGFALAARGVRTRGGGKGREGCPSWVLEGAWEGEGEEGSGLLERSGGTGGGPGMVSGAAIMASAAGGGGGRGRVSRRRGWLALARRAMSRARRRSWKVWNTGGSYATLGTGWGIGTVAGGRRSIAHTHS